MESHGEIYPGFPLGCVDNGITKTLESEQTHVGEDPTVSSLEIEWVLTQSEVKRSGGLMSETVRVRGPLRGERPNSTSRIVGCEERGFFKGVCRRER